jgi:hypothetical protein
MVSIHDSLLTGYSVDGTNQIIVLHTEPHQGGGVAFVDVSFHGVVAYHFEGDCLQNIVFDIEEVPAAQVIGDCAAFAEISRRCAWPRGWDSRRESTEAFFKRTGVRVYELTCSYGIYGWVAAAGMEQVVRS